MLAGDVAVPLSTVMTPSEKHHLRYRYTYSLTLVMFAGEAEVPLSTVTTPSKMHLIFDTDTHTCYVRW